jgi:hypothetical protein
MFRRSDPHDEVVNERREPRPDREVLNKDFYSTPPHEYLMQQVTALLAMREKGEAVKGLLDPEFKVGEVELLTQSNSPEVERAIRHRFVIAESHVLLHHAAETLLRMYLAHVDRPAEPWIVLASEYRFARFKQKIAELKTSLSPGEAADQIHFVFHGSVTPDGLQPRPDRSVWNGAVDNIRAYLIRLAEIFLDSDSYNAAKHGLAVSAGMTQVDVTVEEESVWSASGSTLTYLSLRPEDGYKEWKRVTRWFSPAQSIGLTIATCHLLQLLWTAARHHYLGETGAFPTLFEKRPWPRLRGLMGRAGKKSPLDSGTIGFHCRAPAAE